MSSPLQQELDFYIANQDEMVEKYNGKVVVIKDQQILGVYDNELAAVTDTQKSHDLGTFLIQVVSEGSTGYAQTFHSRVVFS